MKDNELKVQGNPDLVKDVKTGIIKNTNAEAFRAARARKERRLEERQQEKEKDLRIEELENELEQIKALLLRENKE